MNAKIKKTIVVNDAIGDRFECSVYPLDSLLKIVNPYKEELAEIVDDDSVVTIDASRDGADYLFLIWFENHCPYFQAIDCDGFRVLFEVYGSYKEYFDEKKEFIFLPNIYVTRIETGYEHLVKEGKMIIAYIMDEFLNQWNDKPSTKFRLETNEEVFV